MNPFCQQSPSENSVAAYDEWKRAYNEYMNFRDSYEGLTRNEIEEQLEARINPFVLIT